MSLLHFQKNTMKILIDNNEIFSVDDGIEWLKKFMDLESSNWDDLFNLLPLYKINKINKKSAKLALFQASLDQVNQGKIEINQKFHFDKIMIRLKK